MNQIAKILAVIAVTLGIFAPVLAEAHSHRV